MLKLHFASDSDTGLVRGNNEDSAYAGPYLLALADGMGGHAAGEIASQLMITHLQVLDADPQDNDMCALLGSVADDGNRAIAERVRQDPQTEGMGTTLTALLCDGHTMAMIHVGDSRGYLLRDGALRQITVDDTFVQSLVDKGELAPEDVSTHPRRSLILKAYTGHPVEPTLTHLDIRPGDRLLLCSDGLSDPVTHETIEATLGRGTPMDAARALVELALRGGGPDNVTVVVADVVDSNDVNPSQPLPTTPVVAGALNSLTDAPLRPDTSAGRAALLNSPPIVPLSTDGVIAGATEPASPAAVATTAPADEENAVNTRKPRRWLGLAIGLAVVLLLIVVGWIGVRTISSHYYVTTHNDAVVIERGAHVRIFGQDLHQTHQTACLNKDGNLQLADPGDNAAQCTPLTTKALPESARNSLAGLPPGSYDEVVGQLQRLAKDVLPVCINTQSGDLNKPGVNCREDGGKR